MSDRDTEKRGDGGNHEAAARAFTSRVREQFDDEIDTLVVFGSTVRGETAGLASDVDVLVVLRDDVDRSAVEERLRDFAYDVMLERGPVIELHVLTRRRFETLRDRGNPFVRNAVDEGRSYG